MPSTFRLRWKIEGVKELSRILKLEHEKLKDFRKPLFKSSRFVLNDTETQFRTEGSLSGGWAPLALSTAKQRQREGYGSDHPILQKTQSLRKSFYSRLNPKRAFISSRSPYYGFHQSRMSRNKIPRRPMLLLTERTRQNIVEEFHKFLKFN